MRLWITGWPYLAKSHPGIESSTSIPGTVGPLGQCYDQGSGHRRSLFDKDARGAELADHGWHTSLPEQWQ